MFEEIVLYQLLCRWAHKYDQIITRVHKHNSLKKIVNI